MSIPKSFAGVSLEGSRDGRGASSSTTGAESWKSPEGIEIKPAYGPADLDGLEFVPLVSAPADPVHRLSLVTAQGAVEACFCAPDLASLAMAASMLRSRRSRSTSSWAATAPPRARLRRTRRSR